MRYSFDDASFGLTKDGNKIDFPIARRPPGLTNGNWYGFAGELVQRLERCRAALKFAVEGYARIDISHEEYRVQVYMAALDALEPHSYECENCNDTGRRQYGADAMETEPCGCRADLDASS